MSAAGAGQPPVPGSTLVPGLRAEPAADVGAARDACLRKVLEREGIPMVLALHDVRTGQAPAVTDELARHEGERLAVLAEHYRAGLAPLPPSPGAAGPDEPDPTGAGPLIDVLVVLADQHLREDPDVPGERPAAPKPAPETPPAAQAGP